MQKSAPCAGLCALIVACSGDPTPGVAEQANRSGASAGCERVWSARSGTDRATPGEEAYRTYSLRGPTDAFIRRIRPVLTGDAGVVHHIFVTRAGSPDDTGELVFPVLFAGGPGGADLELPPGVGLALSAGEEVVLGLHVVNPRERSAEFDAGIELCLTSAVDEEAAVLSFGPEDLAIPADGTPHRFGATCPIRGDHTVFAVFPHMHGHGIEIELALDGEKLVGIEDWDATHQPLVSLTPPRALSDGQTLSVACSHLNTTAAPVVWGHFADNEMCLAFVYYYPPGLSPRWGCR